MMTRIKTSLVLVILAIIGIGPMPTSSLIAIYVVVFRPSWFKQLVDTLYQGD
jgi:hypothetical protein